MFGFIRRQFTKMLLLIVVCEKTLLLPTNDVLLKLRNSKRTVGNFPTTLDHTACQAMYFPDFDLEYGLSGKTCGWIGFFWDMDVDVEMQEQGVGCCGADFWKRMK